MKFVSPLAFLGLAVLAFAQNLATTTRYFDGQEGACGCGTSSGNFAWQLGIASGVYTAAGSQALFDTDDATWCGGGCGKCYNLTATGPSACSTCGTGETAGASIIVMVTNLCPNAGNEQWCPTVGGTNQYGYSYHFDIMAQSEVFGDNPVVEFEPVACPGQAVSDWEQCVCFGQTASDATPAGLSAAAASSDDTTESDPAPSSSSTSAPVATAATDPTSTAQDPPVDPTSTTQDPAADLASTTAATAADPTIASTTSDPSTSTVPDPATTTSSTVTIKPLNTTVANPTTKASNTTLSATAQLNATSAAMVTMNGASRNSWSIERLIPFALGMLALTQLL